MPVDLAHLGATLAANKPVLIGAGAVGVAGVAYVRKKKAAASAAQPAQGVQTAPSVSAGGQVAGMAGANAYDSSSSDVYGLIQPQLESLGGQLTDLRDKLTSIPVGAPPAPAPAPAPAPPPPAPVYAAPPPPPVPVPGPSHAVDTWVTVNRGDTLSGIAARFPQQDITWQSIARDNGVANPNRIYAGQRFHVVG